MSGIVPPNLQRRAQVAAIFAHYIDGVVDDSPWAAYLEALRVEVLDALELGETGRGGDDTDA